MLNKKSEDERLVTNLQATHDQNALTYPWAGLARYAGHCSSRPLSHSCTPPAQRDRYTEHKKREEIIIEGG